MSSTQTHKHAIWMHKAAHELVEYGSTAVFLGLFFLAFTAYRNFVLAEYRITALHYSASIIEALILAKVVLIGDLLHLGRRFEDAPLALTTLFKAVVFSVFVGVFAVLEHTVIGLIHGKGVAGGIHQLMSHGKDEIFSRILVTFVAFVPFFAFWELRRVLGESKVRALFFRKRALKE